MREGIPAAARAAGLASSRRDRIANPAARRPIGAHKKDERAIDHKRPGPAAAPIALADHHPSDTHRGERAVTAWKPLGGKGLGDTKAGHPGAPYGDGEHLPSKDGNRRNGFSAIATIAARNADARECPAPAAT